MSPATSPENSIRDNINAFKNLLPDIIGLTDQAVARNIYDAFQEKRFTEPWKQELAFELAMLVSHYGIDVALDEYWPRAIQNRANEQIHHVENYYVHYYYSFPESEINSEFHKQTAFELLGSTVVTNQEYIDETMSPAEDNEYADFIARYLRSGEIPEIAALGFLSARSSSAVVIHDEEDIGVELSFIASKYLQKLREINADYFYQGHPIEHGETPEQMHSRFVSEMHDFSIDLLSSLRRENVYWEPSIPEVHVEIMRILFHHD